MGGNEQFVSVEKLTIAYNSVKESLEKMTAECEKLLQFNTDKVAECNQKDVIIAHLTTALDIAQNDNLLLRDAINTLYIALTSTAGCV